MTPLVFLLMGCADPHGGKMRQSAAHSCDGIFQIVQAKAADPDIHNASVRVTAPKNALDCERGFGSADGKNAMTSGNSFRIASIGKLLTATAILQLIEKGKLGLGDRAADILSLPYGSFATLDDVDGRSYGEEITIEQLLNHSSGLLDYVFDDPRFAQRVFAHPNFQWSPTEILKAFYDLGLNQKSPFRPGTGYHYADTNFVILALVIEKLTGQAYQDAVRQLILDRVNMPDTYLERYEAPRGNALLSHPFIGSMDAFSVNTSYDWGGGGFVSTPADMDRFIRALMTSSLFNSPKTLEEMEDLHPPGNTLETANNGLGLTSITIAGVKFFGHGGAWASDVLYAPSLELSVVLTLNQVDAGRDYNFMKRVVEAAIKAASAD